MFCSAQGCCAARGSFGILHQTVILRFAHGAQTGRRIFPPSYLAPNKKSKHFHRTWWDKIPHGGAPGSVGAPPLRRSFLRVRNKPSACRPCGNADTSCLTLSGGRVSKRSSSLLAHFFFGTFFFCAKKKVHCPPKEEMEFVRGGGGCAEMECTRAPPPPHGGAPSRREPNGCAEGSLRGYARSTTGGKIAYQKQKSPLTRALIQNCRYISR